MATNGDQWLNGPNLTKELIAPPNPRKEAGFQKVQEMVEIIKPQARTGKGFKKLAKLVKELEELEK